MAYEQINTLDRDRMYGNTALNLHLYKGLDLMLRGGIDFSRDLRTTRHPKSSYSQKYGMYGETELTSLQLSTDFLLKYDRKLGAGFNITANLGGSIINRSFVQTDKTAEQLKQPGVYSLANSVNRIKTNNYSYERQTNSIYGLVSLSWRDAVYLDITGRNDWSSTLPSNNNSYFYPSVSASVLLNELIDFGTARDIVNLVKLRGSFAQVGNDTKPYRTSNYLTASDFAGNENLGSVEGGGALLGGIVAAFENGSVRGCTNRGDVLAGSKGQAGGIAATTWNGGNSRIESCRNGGVVKGMFGLAGSILGEGRTESDRVASCGVGGGVGTAAQGRDAAPKAAPENFDQFITGRNVVKNKAVVDRASCYYWDGNN